MVKKIFKMYFVLLSTAIFLMFIIGALINTYFNRFAVECQRANEAVVEIPYGSSLRKVSSILQEQHIIGDAGLFYWYLRLGRADGSKVQAGYYKFNGELCPREIAERLLLGRDQSHKLTFKEGQTLVDLAESLEQLGLCNKLEFLQAVRDPEMISLIGSASLRPELKNDGGGLEGYLFPDTYFFAKKDSAKDIIRKMHQRFLSLISPEITSAMTQKNLTLHEVLTLASIIEKETGAAFERPLIASVYLNRLRLGMRLQADPTVIYGIKDYDGKIRKKDLLTYHPYNTYQITGLPPGPIAAPSLPAIKAVLWPQESKYLYFVSKNDGTHEFCEDLACHNKAVQKWQINYFKNASRY